MTDFKYSIAQNDPYPYRVDVSWGTCCVDVMASWCTFETDEMHGNCGCGVLYNLSTEVHKHDVPKLLEGIELAIVSAAKRMSWGKIIFSDNLTNKKRSLSWWDIAEHLGAVSGSVVKNPNHDYKTSIIVWEWDIPRKYKGLD